MLIIFVMATEPFAATREAFDQREGVRVATDEAGAVRCGPGRVVVLAVGGVDEGPLQVVAEVEVRGESVPQILGGEVVQRCPGQGSCERDDIMSLVVDLFA